MANNQTFLSVPSSQLKLKSMLDKPANTVVLKLLYIRKDPSTPISIESTKNAGE